MSRKQKIDVIWDACIAANPRDLTVSSLVRLRHVVVALKVAGHSYRVGAQGYFIDPKTLTATHARWKAMENDLVLQDDACIDFLYERLAHSRKSQEC